MALVLLLALLFGDDPLLIGAVVTPDDAEQAALVIAAQQAVLEWNAEHPQQTVALVSEPLGSGSTAPRQAVAALVKNGASAILAPLHGDPTPVAAAARGAKLGLLTFDVAPEDTATALLELLVGRLRVTRLGWIGDGTRAQEVARALTRSLPYPCTLIDTLAIDDDAKAIDRKLAKAPVDALVIDAAPEAAAGLLRGGLLARSEPIFLTTRAFGPATREPGRELFALLGRSPATIGGGSAMLTAWRAAHGEPHYGAAEGYDAARLLLRALAAGATAGGLPSALEGTTFAGPRGAVTADHGRLRRPLALWKIRNGVAVPYLPSPISADVMQQGTAALRDPDPELGVPFSAWRTDRFELEEDTQWVLMSWGTPEQATIDDDLARLGLSSQGRAPLVDHLIKEELMARLLAFTSSKFLRELDGSARPGSSLRISFATHLPAKAKAGKAWHCVVAGDDEGAGGRAWPGQGRAEVYSTFIRRTIFQPHAIEPPVGADDLPYLDGSYRFGEDRVRDKRSELVRALINGYAGSMALTTAHEIGHLAGLGHVTDDSVDIMNVDEGAGIDHRDGRFSPATLPKLIERLGVTPEPRQR